jgi:hypothetical protein
MFPSKGLIREHLPATFRSFKNVRVIIDCFEIFVQSSIDLVEQGNMYSSYENHTTLNVWSALPHFYRMYMKEAKVTAIL